MNERGFSLAEVMIAMVILAVGVLGVAASSAAITKMTAEGGRSGGAAAAAESLIETLNATPCVNIASSGSDSTGKFVRTWTVTSANLLRTITVNVTYPAGRTSRTSTYVAYISCAPKSK